MKKYIVAILMTLSTIAAQNAFAQSRTQIQKTEQSIKKDGKYALLVMKAQHLKAALMTGIAFKSYSPDIDFQIVTCGELVKEIAQDSALQQLIVAAVRNNGLKVLTCGLSIQQFSVDQSLLPKETPVTENGLVYMFGLQEQGFKTIIL